MDPTREPAVAGQPWGYEHTTMPTEIPVSSPLVRLGGGLGIAACVVGLLIFFAACHGWAGALTLSIVPVLLSLPGLVLTIFGAVAQRDRVSEDTHVLAALFTTTMGLIGGLLEMAAWRGWPLFHA